MKQIETFLKKFPDLMESQFVTDEMMEHVEGGDCNSCEALCKSGCTLECKSGCKPSSKDTVTIPIDPSETTDPDTSTTTPDTTTTDPDTSTTTPDTTTTDPNTSTTKP